MRARVFLPVFVFAVSLPLLADEEKKKDAKDDIKVDLSYLEKTWGIKCKSHRIADSPGRQGDKQVTFLLEFTKDVENLEELRAAFKVKVNMLGPVIVRDAPTSWPLWFYFFDEDNVVVYKSPPNAIEGEISGKKGDVIRVRVVHITSNDFKKILKVEARPEEKKKDKDKAKK